MTTHLAPKVICRYDAPQRDPQLVNGETVQQARAARGDQVLLAASLARMHRVPGRIPAAHAVECPSWAVPILLLVQLLQVWSAASVYARPSGCDPVRISCSFGVSPKPFVISPFS